MNKTGIDMSSRAECLDILVEKSKESR